MKKKCGIHYEDSDAVEDASLLENFVDDELLEEDGTGFLNIQNWNFKRAHERLREVSYVSYEVFAVQELDSGPLGPTIAYMEDHCSIP